MWSSERKPPRFDVPRQQGPHSPITHLDPRTAQRLWGSGLLAIAGPHAAIAESSRTIRHVAVVTHGDEDEGTDWSFMTLRVLTVEHDIVSLCLKDGLLLVGHAAHGLSIVRGFNTPPPDDRDRFSSSEYDEFEMYEGGDDVELSAAVEPATAEVQFFPELEHRAFAFAAYLLVRITAATPALSFSTLVAPTDDSSHGGASVGAATVVTLDDINRDTLIELSEAPSRDTPTCVLVTGSAVRVVHFKRSAPTQGNACWTFTIVRQHCLLMGGLHSFSGGLHTVREGAAFIWCSFYADEDASLPASVVKSHPGNAVAASAVPSPADLIAGRLHQPREMMQTERTTDLSTFSRPSLNACFDSASEDASNAEAIQRFLRLSIGAGVTLYVHALDPTSMTVRSAPVDVDHSLVTTVAAATWCTVLALQSNFIVTNFDGAVVAAFQLDLLVDRLTTRPLRLKEEGVPVGLALCGTAPLCLVATSITPEKNQVDEESEKQDGYIVNLDLKRAPALLPTAVVTLEKQSITECDQLHPSVSASAKPDVGPKADVVSTSSLEATMVRLFASLTTHVNQRFDALENRLVRLERLLITTEEVTHEQ